MAKVDAASQIKAKSLRSLEILRPSLGERGYLELRSTYYSIENRKDFEVFKKAVIGHGEKFSKKIPLEK